LITEKRVYFSKLLIPIFDPVSGGDTEDITFFVETYTNFGMTEKAASSVDSSSASSSSSSDDENDGTTRLFVGNLVPALSDILLRASLSKFGTVSSIERNTERKFAHVSFSTTKPEDLKRCISTLNGTRWMGTVVRVEVATEHFMARLKREWSAEANGIPDEAEAEEEVEELPTSFSWKGKHTIFEPDQFDTSNRRPATDADSDDTDSDADIEAETVSKPSNIDPAAAELFGLEVVISEGEDEPTPTCKKRKPSKPSNIDTAAAELFGLDWEPERAQKPAEVEMEMEIVAAPKAAARVKPSKEASKADLETVTAIGNDPSKIDLSSEHERQRNIIAQLFGGNNAIANRFSAANRCKSKSLYLRFENINNSTKKNDVAPQNGNKNKKNKSLKNTTSPLGVPIRPFSFHSANGSTNTNLTGSRKGLYKQISKERIRPKVQ